MPLAAQRLMCERAGAEATEVPGSHAIYVSNPEAVATLIETAASQCHAVSGRWKAKTLSTEIPSAAMVRRSVSARAAL
jgi:hypothetical protein